MSEEANEEQQQPEKGNRGNLITIVIALIVVIVAVVGGLLTYRLVIAPMLAPPEEATEQEKYEEIPLNPVMVAFEDSFVNVMREQDLPASTLLFGVTLECTNQETADLIELHRVRFKDMISKLHDSRTRAELDDVLLLKESIQKQAKQKCNDLLKRLMGDANPEMRITAVFHSTFAVQDQI